MSCITPPILSLSTLLFNVVSNNCRLLNNFKETLGFGGVGSESLLFSRKFKLMICPRCLTNQIPNNENPGLYPGALSRVDNLTEICSDCGLQEALEDFFKGSLSPISSWPVEE
jgi:hypothetical protein